MSNFKNYFNNINGEGKYTKSVECVNSRDFYFGIDYDGNPSMLYYYTGNVYSINSSRYIEAAIFVTPKKQKCIKITLNDVIYFEQFEQVCTDLIHYTNTKSSDIAMHLVIRWESWRKLFTNKVNDILSEYKIKGLLGELSEIIKLNDLGLSMSDIIEAWSGPQSGHQDFVFADYWIEVKSTSIDSDVIKISSVEQLDKEEDGYLELFELEKTTSLNENSINLNIINSLIINRIYNSELLQKYTNKLLEVGYQIDKAYDEFNYVIVCNKTYTVDQSFECIRRKSLPSIIGNLKYDLYKNKLDEWLVELCQI